MYVAGIFGTELEAEGAAARRALESLCVSSPSTNPGNLVTGGITLHSIGINMYAVTSLYDNFKFCNQKQGKSLYAIKECMDMHGYFLFILCINFKNMIV